VCPVLGVSTNERRKFTITTTPASAASTPIELGDDVGSWHRCPALILSHPPSALRPLQRVSVAAVGIRLPAVRCCLTLRLPLPLFTAHADQDDQDLVLIMSCGSHTDTVVMRSRSSRTGVDLTCQHKNHTVLVEGPEIKIRPVGTRPQSMHGRFSTDQLQTMIDLYQSGATAEQLAHTSGFSTRSIKRLLQQHSIRREHRNRS
jgi:hypothetical protein